MNETERPTSPWLILAGVYAATLAGAILLGTLVSLGDVESYPGNAVRMPFVAALIALALGAAAVALFLRANWGRFLFLVAAPWGSIALGSAFAKSLWQKDVPYTALAIFAYVPIAFLLARGGTLRAVGAKDGKWLSRGGPLVLACAGVMFLARLAVVASKPSGGGGFLGTMVGLNEYVQRLVLCDVPLWNYVMALIAVSIPTRFKAKADAQPGAGLAGDSATLHPRP